MRVLLDNNVNRRFAGLLAGHEVLHAREVGWRELLNGDLLAAAEGAGFDAIITADKQMQYQQILAGRRLGIIVLNSRFIRWADIVPLAPQVQALLDGELGQGAFVLVGSGG